MRKAMTPKPAAEWTSGDDCIDNKIFPPLRPKCFIQAYFFILQLCVKNDHRPNRPLEKEEVGGQGERGRRLRVSRFNVINSTSDQRLMYRPGFHSLRIILVRMPLLFFVVCSASLQHTVTFLAILSAPSSPQIENKVVVFIMLNWMCEICGGVQGGVVRVAGCSVASCAKMTL